MTQLTLNYAPARPTGKQARQVHGCLMAKSPRWQTLYEMQRWIKIFYGDMYSDASISARVRDLRNKHGIEYEKRQRAGSSAFEYRIKGQCK